MKIRPRVVILSGIYLEGSRTIMMAMTVMMIMTMMIIWKKENSNNRKLRKNSELQIRIELTTGPSES